MQQRMTISDLARTLGVDVALISRRVKALRLQTWPGPHGAKFVAIEDYKKAVEHKRSEAQQTTGLLELMRRKGKLGQHEEAAARMRFAHLYQRLRRQACGGDLNADEALREIDRELGADGSDLCRRILIAGHALDQIELADRSYWQRRFVECLDLMGRKFGTLQLDPPHLTDVS